MSSRKLGGGRVLGSGKGLVPASAAHPQRSSSLLSPSASSISVTSSTSTQPSTDAQDLSSRVSFEHHDENNGTAVEVGPRLACPICNEAMVTLLQLNRHLDDNHKNLEEVKQDEVKDWFKTQMVKAKKFQPLAVLNQKFKGLDVFEPNEPPRSSTPVPNAALQERPAPDPDEVVTRAHWQKHGLNDPCSDPACGKRLGTANGKVNCRKCGRVFCDEHTMYQMKLSRSAQHEPVRGFWCRVCETCYKSRDGYNDRHEGLEQDLTTDFEAFRRKTVDKTLMEVSRLEKRLTKLTQLLANPPSEPSPNSGGLLWSISGARNQRKQLEQSIVTWEDDASVLRCPFCQQEFSTYTFRRHHCRLCGRVVCGDPITSCSQEIGLSVATDWSFKEKATGGVNVDVRMCKDCRNTVFGRQDFAATITEKPPDVRAYENLVQFEGGITSMLPRFQRLLLVLQDPDKPPSPAQLAEASRVRKRLTEAFNQYNSAARRIRDLPTQSPTQQQLQKAVFQQATNFLHIHMLPLKSLPQVLKHATAHGQGSSRFASPNGRSSSALASIKFNEIETASHASSSSAVSALEAEEKVLRESLIVLEEQSFLIKEQISNASKRRKFDEVSSLSLNLEDLSTEIDRIHGQLGQLDFASAYNGINVSTPPAK
ncbi:MAG: carboxypeptidase Y-deficient [Heterodermia speciosa]|uniref:Carboxypeptidase Y-deficient n=1 Tax=Heterodermia speciosa TaxID=116794 RepID=A0A8H3GA95_9LECA|nr:MAG: carboxypeptidase Y-deficient [Heterodermia speciosa]